MKGLKTRAALRTALRAALASTVLVLFSCVDLASIVITMPDLSRVADGTWVGKYTVGPVLAKVSVGVAAGRITIFSILEHRNGRGKAAEALAPLVVERQSVALDAIAGATYSSKAILKAGQNALESGIR
jgi:uncharacterized protein with FMN-binding domain